MIKSQSLEGYRFTNGNDLVVRVNLEIKPGETVDALPGNDAIIGYSPNDDAIFIEKGSLRTSSGDDLVLGVSAVDSGRGPDDRGHGIHNLNGTIRTGSGDDLVVGANSSRGRAGILTGGLIGTGNGDDVIIGAATLSSGIRVDRGGELNTGDGNDVITGIAVNVKFGSAVSVQGGKIDMGDGDDLLDVNAGGISGNGSIALGAGNDTFSGFTRSGTVQINGGKGDDLIVLADATYTVSIEQGMVSFSREEPVQAVLEVRNFEWVSFGGQTFAIADLQNQQVLGA